MCIHRCLLKYVAKFLSMAAASKMVAQPFVAEPLADLEHCQVELEAGGEVAIEDGVMTIDVPRGATVWYRQPMQAPVAIEYQAMAVHEGGPNDRVSDLNCFWMARDARNPENLFAVMRSGKFQSYDILRCYYVGLGGHDNMKTRFRRYIGKPGNRPLKAEHDLDSPDVLLKPNTWQTIRIEVDDAGRTRYQLDGRVLFDVQDDDPYTSGWFAFRTVNNHLRIKNFIVSST
jgi:hypothetical protein